MSAVGSRTDSTRTSPLGRSRPRPDIGRIKIPQRSSLLCAIPFVRKHRRYWAVKRREFITLLGGAAASWPLAARAQQERVRRIGVLMPSAADDPEFQARMTAFLQELAQLGWIDGRNVRIDTRWGVADADRIRKYAAELVAGHARASALEMARKRALCAASVQLGHDLAAWSRLRLQPPAAHSSGRDEQIFGAEQQVLHGG